MHHYVSHKIGPPRHYLGQNNYRLEYQIPIRNQIENKMKISRKFVIRTLNVEANITISQLL